ncbi:uncharacterized protein LACBIDRAFT_307406 [Laccaria bicolor S238N-H82]|uniref:Predicted protein n=1 Tax=Laccaria bicolor (strain S238N-H82 / ATCC MYA-4686) TaxID=486041 RepID=B0DQ26_LACBS|nr:uncharacterized protein LACBIDRAFT_307406 [Laccaria bicolor S238N-H82]EDR03216.1 predicted protein [Laccaria bicolor S238N-H82]|eukprot:XP_001886012.1 predicted protein [Laccaria bicolor S238N-H82]
MLRIASIAFLLGCLVLFRTDAEKQLWMGSQVGCSKKSRGNHTIRWDFFNDRLSHLYAEIVWNHRCDEFNPSGFWCWCPPTAYSDCVSQCTGVPNPDVGGVALAWVWPILLGFVVNASTLILLNLPAYHRGRALHVLYGLSDDDDSQSQLTAWEQLIRPLLEEWKTVCVLATLTSGAALATFQIPSFNNNLMIPALAYLTLISMTTAILLSSIVIIHLGGETRDPVFIQTWLESGRCGEFLCYDTVKKVFMRHPFQGFSIFHLVCGAPLLVGGHCEHSDGLFADRIKLRRGPGAVDWFCIQLLEARETTIDRFGSSLATENDSYNLTRPRLEYDGSSKLVSKMYGSIHTYPRGIDKTLGPANLMVIATKS